MILGQGAMHFIHGQPLDQELDELRRLRQTNREPEGLAMPFVHVQSDIFRRPSNQRYYLFLRWHAQGGRWYQVADFATVTEASCFLLGARAASNLSNKAVRLETMTPTAYESAQQKRLQRKANKPK
jgi:hypothetical protein